VCPVRIRPDLAVESDLDVMFLDLNAIEECAVSDASGRVRACCS